METFYGAVVAAVIGSALIIINEWTKILSEQRKQKKKFNVWKILELTKQGTTAPNLTVEQISEKTGLSTKRLEPLLYEMIQEGAIHQGVFEGTYTRYPLDIIGGLRP